MSLGHRVRAAWRALRGRTQYAGAKTTISTGEWNPVDSAINTVLQNSIPNLRSRARQLVRDMPHAARAVQLLEDYVVGDGLHLQPRVLDPATVNKKPQLWKRVNRQIEDAWKFWMDEADDARRLHFHDLTALAKRQDAEPGEFLTIKKQSQGTGRYLPFSLQILEGDVLTGMGTALPGNELHQGIEYDPRTGRVMAYHMQDGDQWTYRNVRRIPAAQVVHGYKTLRPNQLRGVTPFAPAILMAHSLRDYLEAELDGARMAARWLAFIKSSDPLGTMAGFGAQTTTIASDPNGRQRKVEEAGTAIKEYLYQDEDVTIASHKRPGDTFDPFTQFVLRSFAVVVGVSYEFLTNDYRGMNYSVQKGSRTQFQQQIRVLRARHIRQWCQPIYREFLDWAVLAGRLDLPQYFRNPYPYLRVSWLGPGMESIDPLREGKAAIELVKAKLMSPQRYLMAQGVDPDQMLDDLSEWDEMLEDRGLTVEDTSAALANNPAAVDPDTAEELDRALLADDDAAVERALLRRVK